MTFNEFIATGVQCTYTDKIFRDAHKNTTIGDILDLEDLGWIGVMLYPDFAETIEIYKLSGLTWYRVVIQEQVLYSSNLDDLAIRLYHTVY